VAGVNVRVSVLVSGLGPKFLLRISLQNAGSSAVLNSKLVFSYDSALYSVRGVGSRNASVPVPALLPGPKHCFEAEAVSIDPQGRAAQIILMLVSMEKGAAANR
jgi:hypothetical protein